MPPCWSAPLNRAMRPPASACPPVQIQCCVHCNLRVWRALQAVDAGSDHHPRNLPVPTAQVRRGTLPASTALRSHGILP